MKACIKNLLLLFLLLAMPVVVQAQTFTNSYGIWNYTSTTTNITITGYTGTNTVLTIPSTIAALPVTSIGSRAFFGSSLTSVTISTNVTSLGGDAFDQSDLINVTIGTNVTSIGDDAFANCTSMMAITVTAGNSFYSSVNGVLFNKNQTTLIEYPGAISGSYTIPGGVTSIMDEAFEECSLTNVTITNTVNSIGDDAFVGCTNLISINVSSSNPSYSSLAGVLFNKSQTTLIQYPGGISGGYTIPGSVTGIGNDAFEECNLTGVTIPNSVNSIGSYAFEECGLKSVTIPGSVISIGDGAFGSCYSLTNAVISTNVTSMGQYVFSGSGLTSVSISNSVIGVEEFYGCTSLTSVTMSTNIINIGDEAFEFCSSLTNITISGNVTSMGNYVFGDCSNLKSATIANGVTSIGGYMFWDCTSLANVIIGTNVTSIGAYAFESDNNLTSVVIPNSVIGIGTYAFAYCIGLSSIAIGTNVISIGDYAFYTCASLMSITIPASVTYIGNHVFDESLSSGLTNFYFLGNTPSIGSSVFFGDNNATVYYYAGTAGWSSTFGGLPTKQVNALVITTTLLANGTNGAAYSQTLAASGGQPPYSWSLLTGGLQSGLTLATSGLISGTPTVAGTSNLTIRVTDAASSMATQSLALTINLATFTTNNNTFSYISTTTNVTIAGYSGSGGIVVIPTTIIGLPVTSIGNYAFQYSITLTSITIPNTVTSIGTNAFYYCYYLTNAAIPSSVTSIGQGAFENSALTSVTISNNIIGDYEFSGCESLPNVTIPNTVTNIGQYAFNQCNSLTNITIPGSVISIGIAAFNYCFNMSSVVMSNGVTTIGTLAFAQCQKLSSVTIPGSVTTIGSAAFSACHVLANITIPNGVASIGFEAFSGCSLTNIIIPNSVTNISPAFGDCYSLPAITVSAGNSFYSSLNGVLFNNNQTTLVEYPAGTNGSYTIPNTVTNIGDWAFDDCTNLTGITIPSSVISFGQYSFADSGLISIIIPASVTSIGNHAFDVSSVTPPNDMISIIFNGNAPSIGTNVFSGQNIATVYYYAGTTGWSSTFGGLPTKELGIQSAKLANGQFMLTWSAVSNGVYQLQYKTNLLQTNWINGGSIITASNTVLSATNAIGADQQRFYRVQQQ
jgi:hypothetical protein